MDWSLFATILKIILCLVALGVMAWLFSVLDYYWAIVCGVVSTYASLWFLYLVVWHIHQMSTKFGLTW
jgi:hypothetical protein